MSDLFGNHIVGFSTRWLIYDCVLLTGSLMNRRLTHLSLTSLLWDIGKKNSPRCDAAECGVPSGAILFANRIFIEKSNKM